MFFFYKYQYLSFGYFLFHQKKDGDYNQNIKEMHTNENKVTNSKRNYQAGSYKSTNCLCERCNFYQQLKIEKLSKFEPKNEITYEFEMKQYKEYLEKIYTLCLKCQSKVKFEITKQDGMLKHYLLNLKMFNDKCINYFQQKTKCKKPQTIKKQSNEFWSYFNIVKILLLMFMYMLSILILLYNGQEKTCSSDISILVTHKSDSFLTTFTNTL